MKIIMAFLLMTPKNRSSKLIGQFAIFVFGIWGELLIATIHDPIQNLLARIEFSRHLP
jgi:hypothetical protein